MARQNTIGSHKTTVSTTFGTTSICYHDTVVVSFSTSKITLNSGVWHTSTTKARMNQASRQFGLGFSIFQRDFEWFVDYKNETLPFYDGMQLDR